MIALLNYVSKLYTLSIFFLNLRKHAIGSVRDCTHKLRNPVASLTRYVTLIDSYAQKWKVHQSRQST